MSNNLIISEEKIRKILRTIITEELGIAREVIALTNEVEEKLNNFIKSDKTTDYIPLKTDLAISLEKHFCNSIADYSQKEKSFLNSYSFDNKELELHVFYINGKPILENIYDSIQHELEHYWQCTKKKGKLSNNQYQKITSYAQNDHDYLMRLVGSILYATKHFEIDAYVNGAYNVARKDKNNFKTKEDFINKTNLINLKTFYNNLKIAINDLFLTPSLKKIFDEMTSDLDSRKKLNPQSLYKILNRGEAYLDKKINMVFKLLQNNV